jgi:DNA-binding beta-propeller fold protein YncE
MADFVLGQADHSTCAVLATSAVSGFSLAQMIADGPGNRLFVPETASRHRVIVYEFDGGISTGMSASWVIGQPDFVTQSNGAGTAGLNSPSGIAYDFARKRLFVGDEGNHRVVIYTLDGGTANGMSADVVLGQPDFTSTSSDAGNARFKSPKGLAYDPVTQRLFVSDSGNGRVLVFEAANPTSGAAASFVIGQTDFLTTRSGNPPEKLSIPRALQVDSIRRRLFFTNSNRVLAYDLYLLATGIRPSTVFGRQSFLDAFPRVVRAVVWQAP